ncbi:23S rRNA (guanosine2251-2-O)-methyltransferase [Trypanosoma conorhini]|uniref:23S rRNA (Guanosine2251-2-O)-methyltransferase n=1 Tax=Trypanosoma conorhini TaxID=83891 RepID=A0A3R7RYU2_9TRYP|nr:23S rRNA (guanosine2251-2-O)-methyltransferase [Trypanosoma conorhini]RNF16043.1 23S rRNA (guanosine2251-2-O)-methyltransferase [Trypanosoma conorhini]
MQRGSRRLHAVNRSTGHRWSPIPKPPPPHVDRLCGTHSVLNALRAFYNAAGCRHPHRQRLHCLFVRDFRLALGGTDADAASTRAAAGAVADNTSIQRAREEEGEEVTETESRGSHGDVWVPSQYPNLQRIVRLARALRLDVRAVERFELVQLCGERRNQNVVLELASYTPWEVVSCPWPGGGGGGGRSSRDGEEPPSGHPGGDESVLFLDHVIDPGNVGAVMRSAFFLGVRCVVLSCDSAGCSAAVARASAGLMEHMAVYRSVVPTTTFLANTIAQHKARGDPCRLEIYAAITTPQHAAVQDRRQSTEVTERRGGVGPMRRRLLLLGNEDKGLPREVVRLCSHAVHIPSPRRRQQQQQQPLPRAGVSPKRAKGTGRSAGDALQDDAAVLRPQEVSLNVSAAAAIILAALLAGDRSVEIHRLG